MRFWLVVTPGLVLFLLFRLAVLDSTILVEDTDSISYLRVIQAFTGEELPGDSPITIDLMPMFPATAALIKSTGFSAETAARLASLAWATLGYLCLLLLLWRLMDWRVVLVAGLLMAVAPELVQLDVGILTEPTYIGLIYAGLFLYMRRWDQPPRLWHGLLVGLVFGASFLARTEGIALLLLIPALHLACVLAQRSKRTDWGRHTAWAGAFVAGFALLAGPQIAWVSAEYGDLAINGRQVWMNLTGTMSDLEYDEQIYGLHFDPARINLVHVQDNPDALDSYVPTDSETAALGLFDVDRITTNTNVLVSERIRQLIGLRGMLLAVLGVATLGFVRRWRILLLPLAIPFIMMGPVVLHNVVLRHIMLITPALLVLIATGLTGLLLIIERSIRSRFAVRTAHLLLIAGMVGVFAYRSAGLLHAAISSPQIHNFTYAPLDYEPMIDLIEEMKQDDEPVVLIARKSHFGYLADVSWKPMPWTDYNGLVRYAMLNRATLLLSQENLNSKFPFVEELALHHDTFELIYSGPAGRSNVALYRFNVPAGSEHEDDDG